MVSYFLDEKPRNNGSRIVRSAYCPDLPEFYDRVYLGEYERLEPALKKASLRHARIKECAGCRTKQIASQSCAPGSALSGSEPTNICSPPLMVKSETNR